jgi:hypothetical protein
MGADRQDLLLFGVIGAAVALSVIAASAVMLLISHAHVVI